MSYKMFLDDERFPVGENWIIVRSVAEAQDYVEKNGAPRYVSFDNDLGENMPEGRMFAAWLVDQDLNTGFLPLDFDFYVHSQNPIAKNAIEGLMSSYLQFKTHNV